MTRLKLPACFAVILASGVGLVRLASQAGVSPHHAGPGVIMAVGLLLASAALGVRVGVYDQGHLAFRRAARLALLGGLTVGTSLVLLGLFAALTTLL
jgi:hypothetical protein